MRPGSLLRVYALTPLIKNLNLTACTILDIGGFDGSMASVLRNDYKANIVILDLNESGLRNARQMDLDVLLGSALQIPAQTSSVDGVICLDVIEHIMEYQKAIHEIARVTKPAGILFLTTTADNFYLPLISRKWLNSKWGHLRNGYSDNELEEMLCQSGFRILNQGR
jgi:ubiquinone/menaquinone biosynthesis C-methylase UbiE